MVGRALPKKWWICLGAVLVSWPASVIVAQAGDGLAGHWVGAVLARPAELEYDVSLDIAAASGQKPTVLLSLPGQGVRRHEVQELSVGGGKISFVYDDGKDRSLFSGSLAKDGRTIEGTLSEAGKTFPFVLERRPLPAGGDDVKPVVRSLSRSGAELRKQFSQDDGHVRMIAILSPTCPGCQNCARIVRRYVFEKIDDPDLRAYVVWEPVYPQDKREAAEQSASLIADPRVTHFWEDGRSIGNAFQKAVGLESSPAWDVILVFSGDKRWTADGPAPAPDFFMHNLKGSELPQERRLNGAKLMAEVRAALTEGKKK
jgi:hypothetical protein